ncbi:MAG: CRISPR-associated protein Cas4 [Thaumarchaeota archaeon]|jgi:CRISPR-associated exonuclease Cas4|nr:CRISPR-associated protein Cas4 [Candidatus Terraquivivens yellowstonensis]
MEQEFITPIHVRDYIFCPMLFYHKYVVGLLEPMTEMMLEGSREYLRDEARWRERKTLLNERRIKADRMLFSYPLTSKKYRIHGIADTIFWVNRKMNILEIKYGSSSGPFRNHLYQAAAYALMAEEEFSQPAYKIILFYKTHRKWVERRFTMQLRAYLIKVLERAWEVLEGKLVLEPKPRAPCASCWYRRFCYP